MWWKWTGGSVPGHTQCLGGEVYGLAVRAVASLVASADLEGVDGAGDQGHDSRRVGLAEHAGRAVLVWTLQRDTSNLGFYGWMWLCVCVCVSYTWHSEAITYKHLVIVSELVLWLYYI